MLFVINCSLWIRLYATVAVTSMQQSPISRLQLKILHSFTIKTWVLLGMVICFCNKISKEDKVVQTSLPKTDIMIQFDKFLIQKLKQLILPNRSWRKDLQCQYSKQLIWLIRAWLDVDRMVVRICLCMNMQK